MKTEKRKNQPIDFVIPWVDGGDEEWIKQKQKYSAQPEADSSSSRYRDWEVLRYWFRGVEKFAPWVRTVHFITCGQCPEWLNKEHKKLHFVTHQEYIPEEFLPTFSSHTIELNLHRIKGLSEQFVYFNDDVFLTSRVSPSDFFKKGLPCDRAVMNAVANTDIHNFMPHILMNNMGIINMHFGRETLKRDWKKWYSLIYGRDMLKNILLRPWNYYTGFSNYHLCTPFLKSTFAEVWREEPEILSQTCSRKFRSKSDVNQYLMRYWQFLSGRFVPGKLAGVYLTIGQDSADKICQAIVSGKYKAVCVNDDPFEIDFELEKKNLVRAFERILPEKSGFEK